jgi:hypothetical protein
MLFLLIPLLPFAQKKNGSDFTLVFGDCFHGDTISAKIQGVQVATNKRVESNVAGKANLTVSQNKKALIVEYKGKSVSFKRVTIHNTINIQIIADKIYVYTFQLSKGRMFLVQYCPVELHKKIITVEQGTGPFLFI